MKATKLKLNTKSIISTNFNLYRNHKRRFLIKLMITVHVSHRLRLHRHLRNKILCFGVKPKAPELETSTLRDRHYK